MRLAELSRELAGGYLRPVYLICGEESYLARRAVSILREFALPQGQVGFNLTVFNGRECSENEVVGAADTLPFLASRRLVLVEDAVFFKPRPTGAAGENLGDVQGSDRADGTGPETGGKGSFRTGQGGSRKKGGVPAGGSSVLEYLRDPSPNSCLVFTFTGKVDARLQLYKAVARVGAVVECLPLKGRELLEWIREEAAARGLGLDQDSIGYLVTATGSNLALLDQELAKLATYLGAPGHLDLASVKMLAVRSADIGVFEAIDAACTGRVAEAVSLFRELVRCGEPEVRLAYMITRQVRLMLQAKLLLAGGYSEAQVVEAMEIHPFAARKALSQSHLFSRIDLKAILTDLLLLDEKLKRSAGKSSRLLEFALLKLAAATRKSNQAAPA